MRPSIYPHVRMSGRLCMYACMHAFLIQMTNRLAKLFSIAVWSRSPKYFGLFFSPCRLWYVFTRFLFGTQKIPSFLIAPLHQRILLECNKNLNRYSTHHTIYVGIYTCTCSTMHTAMAVEHIQIIWRVCLYSFFWEICYACTMYMYV